MGRGTLLQERTLNKVPYAPLWRAATTYNAGDLVTYRGVTYQATGLQGTSFVSGATFTASNWNAVADAPSAMDLIGPAAASFGLLPERLDAHAQRGGQMDAGFTYWPCCPQTGSTALRANNTLTVIPWPISTPTRVVKLWLNVTIIGDTGSVFRPCIYADNGHDYPGDLVCEGPTVAGDAVAQPSSAVDVILQPGLYWLGGVTQLAPGTLPSIMSTSSSYTPPVPIRVGTGSPPSSGTNAAGYSATGVTGQLPSQFPTTLAVASSGPKIAVTTAAALPLLPTAPLRWRSTALDFFPTSVGYDGFVYGYHTAFGVSKIARSRDGGNTIEYGYDFAGHVATGENIIWAGCTKAGNGQTIYVAITSTDVTIAANTGAIYTARNFDGSGGGTYARRQITGSINPLTISRPLLISGASAFAVGEYTTYSTPSIARTLWMTFDGGDTWTAAKTTTVSDNTVNSHFHATVYDSTKARWWTSEGDLANARFSYSDDSGATWTPVATPATSPVHDVFSNYVQPTTLVSFPTVLVGTPDRSALPPGLWKSDVTTGLAAQHFRLPTPAPAQAADWFARSPYVQSGNLAILAFPDKRIATSPRVYFVGTGDAGLTWHSLGWVPLTAMDTGERGVVGPDSFGNVYWRSVGNPAPYGDNLLIAPLPSFA